MIRVLLVDDEEPARDRLRQLLRAFEDIEVVGEAQEGEEAIGKILETKPDLVFLDIQMPGCSGLEVAASLPSPRPRIIFCTAFDQYAVDAFEVYALDYLLKPVNRARLHQAVDRVRKLSTAEYESVVEKVNQAARATPARFLAKRGSKFRVVSQPEILYFTSEDGLTKLHAHDQQYWMEPTLTDLEKRLDPSAFCRISRAAIVNLDAVHEVVPLIGGHGEVLLKNGTRLEVSRRRLKELMQKLEGV